MNDPVDAYYTPSWAAEALANALPENLQGRVFDPAAGGGALLRAVEQRFGRSVDLVGMDIDGVATRLVRQAHPGWVVSTGDSLHARSRSATRAWRAARKSLSAVVINPPYSYRGNSGRVVRYGQFKGRVAPSVHFLLDALTSLNARAGYFAILPDGALDAERSAAVWQEVQRDFSVERIQRLRSTSFRGARVSTSIVEVQRLETPVRDRAFDVSMGMSATTFAEYPLEGCKCVDIIRGRVPIHKMRSALPCLETPFIHTTDLHRTDVVRRAPDALADDAPLMLLSRVGKWRSPRSVDVGRVVLSDCIIAIRPRSHAAQIRLTEDIETLAPEFRDCMRGTGAPYLTLNDVREVLIRNGWSAQIVKASSPAVACDCQAKVKASTRFAT